MTRPEAMKPYRLAEAAIVTGFTGVGAIFSFPDVGALLELRSAALFSASFLTILSVYAFNSWGGIRDDVDNPRLSASNLVSGVRYLIVSAVTLILALAIFSLLRPLAAPWCFAVFALTAIYSCPRYGTKYIPIAGTITHFAIGIAQFQQGWSLFRAPNVDSFAISTYFALVLCSGHVNHELIDHEADIKSGISSGAARFGALRWKALHLILAALGFALLTVLCCNGVLAPLLALPFGAASLFHVAISAVLLGRGSAQSSFTRHRSRYRLFYAAAGAAVFVIRAAGWSL